MRNFQYQLDKLRISGTASNTVLSYQKDLKYFWAWMLVAKKIKEEFYPLDGELIDEFTIDHLEGLTDDIDQAMVDMGAKNQPGKHAVSTVERRIKAFLWIHRTKGLEPPVLHPLIRAAIADAKRAESKAGRRPRQSRAITKPILLQMIETFDFSLTGRRARAILEFGFFTGGRRRSEIAAAEMQYLTKVRGGYEYLLHRSKTDQTGKGHLKPLRQASAQSTAKWIDAAGIRDGFLFRVIKSNEVLDDPINPAMVNSIVKQAAEAIGENPKHFSAHGLRRGFITECGRQGISIQDAMQLSGHKDIKTAMRYHEEGILSRNPATRL